MGLLGVLGAAALSAVQADDGQVTITTPTPSVPGQTQRQGEADYGTPRVADLDGINLAPESYQHAHVITLGRLDILEPGQYWTLRDGSATVLLLVGYGVAASDLDPFVGGRVEIRGIVRPIQQKEYIRGVDADLIKDPSLPVLPAPRFGWPTVSITVLALADRGERGAGKAAPAGALTRDIIANPAEHLGKTVRILGQFRGHNLFGDLPAQSRRDEADWVLKDGDLALWVTGKPPRGKGFSLDPGYKGDTVRWLEVAGKAEVVGGIVYLRASKIALAAKRNEALAADP